MRSKWLVGLVLAVFVVSVAAPASAGQGDSMVRIKPGYDGNIVINLVCALVGCVNKGPLDVLPGDSQPGTLYLVANLPVVTWLLNLVLSSLGIASVEADLPVDPGRQPVPQRPGQRVRPEHPVGGRPQVVLRHAVPAVVSRAAGQPTSWACATRTAGSAPPAAASWP